MEQLLTVAAVLLGLVLLVLLLKKRGLAQFNLRTPGGGRERNMEVVERLSLTAQHSLHLVRVKGHLLVVSVSPSGCSLIKDTSQQTARDVPAAFQQESFK